jgi:threonine aldolase
VSERDWREIRWSCERWLGSRRPAAAADELRAAADALPADARPDLYGEGELVEGFEQRVAGLLGKDAAALLPSGTMTQQIALRIHCDRRRIDTVAFHPTCHLELHEHAGYAHLHGLKPELVGDRDRLIELADLEGLQAPIGALLLELPQREIGGRLPEWDDLVAQIEWARSRDVATHLDGARIWEAAPYYERPHAEVAALFDTVYVSLYKGLGGFAGSLLAGPEELVAEARVWRRRQGGALFNLYPLVAAASAGSTCSCRRCRTFSSTLARLRLHFARFRESRSFRIHRRRRSFTCTCAAIGMRFGSGLSTWQRSGGSGSSTGSSRRSSLVSTCSS